MKMAKMAKMDEEEMNEIEEVENYCKKSEQEKELNLNRVFVIFLFLI